MMEKSLLGHRYAADGKSPLALTSSQCQARDELLEHIASHDYSFESLPCPVCQGERFTLLAEKDRYGIPQSVVICNDCGLVQSRPHMTQESYAHFYEHIFRRLYVGASQPEETYFSRRYRAGEAMLRLIREHAIGTWALPASPFLLEVGCGSGGVLAPFAHAGFSVAGIDLDPGYLQAGRERFGFDLRYGFLADHHFEKAPDVILYMHALEHILDPLTELATVRRTLRPGGLVAIEVPGIASVPEKYSDDFLRLLQSSHLWHFTRQSLCNLMARAGYACVYCSDWCRGLFVPVEDAEKPEIISDYDPCRSLLKHLEWRRRTKGLRRIGRHLAHPVAAASKVAMLVQRRGGTLAGAKEQLKNRLRPYARLARSFLPVRTGVRRHRPPFGAPRVTHVAFFAHTPSNAGDKLLPFVLEDLVAGTDTRSIRWVPSHVHHPVDPLMVRRINRTRGLIVGGGGAVSQRYQSEPTEWLAVELFKGDAFGH